MNAKKHLRERLEDVYDGSIDWIVGRWEMFDWTNLKSSRNWWAILMGSLVLTVIPYAILDSLVSLPRTLLGILVWTTYAVVVFVATLAVGSAGVARCRACGGRLRKGYYVCRKCGGESAPRVMR